MESDVLVDYSSYLQNIQDDISQVRVLYENLQTVENPDYYSKINDVYEVLISIQELLTISSGEDNKAETQTVSMVQLDESSMKVLKEINSHTLNAENWLIAIAVGVGLVFGVICTLIFSNFVRH